MSTTLALVGNPNCGKTTLFNELTGSSQYVGNWPGVTVEKKAGSLRKHNDVKVMDLPGIYSLSPYTLEEVITRDYLLDEKPDVIINIVDASNLERNLYLTTQVLELGIPVIVALNMMDIVKRNGDEINIANLEQELGCPVCPIAAINGTGLWEMVDKALSLVQNAEIKYSLPVFQGKTLETINAIEEMLTGKAPENLRRWYAVKVFERDERALNKYSFLAEAKEQAEKLITACEDELDDDAESIVTSARYFYIDSIINKCIKKKLSTGELSTSDKIDKLLTNRILALPIFFFVMWVVYYVSIQTLGDMSIGLMEDIFGSISDSLSGMMEEAGVSETIHGLVIDGIIGGVGAVFGFVPQIMILFFFLSFLEDCGYMSRVAFIMDRIFRRFGLSGKSFIPMLIGSGCSVPGIMASRTIENEQDRKLTIMLTPFIPCSAKMPVFVLFAASLFPEESWVGPSMYFWGIAMVIISGILLKKTSTFGGQPAPFVMELPQYHWPSLKGVAIHMWERAKSFIIKAGTVIFVASALVWLLQSFNFSLEMVEAEDSMLAIIGGAIAPIFAPMGFGTWQAAFAALSGFLAKEVVVSTFAILAGIGEAAEDDPNLIQVIQTMFTPASAYAFMIFTLLASPCFAAIGAIRREMGTWKWTFIAMGYQTVLAYVMATLIYQIGSRIF
ncbi:MAG TPA: ferrous iron transport protein B [Candidatus Avacidaminococcus intestinavium]|uniref:Ferrous iron transport protein B n=1 Tax=Candidatus Avacidaminococcus intestinavium TaxID=2840684 RepID=A0A9D1MRE4_9FIRM|nr:ferrous iron transport protein B [Candidatus Avacidaminococcus intestinavium]